MYCLWVSNGNQSMNYHILTELQITTLKLYLCSHMFLEVAAIAALRRPLYLDYPVFLS